MKYAVLGTGMVGNAISARLAELGHEVTMGTRDPAATQAREGYQSIAGVALATFADAAAGAEVVVNATNGDATLTVLEQAGAANLAGKPLVDLSNGLDFSGGFPPLVTAPQDDSIGEQVQRAFPDALVVKTLNTLNADLMVHPETLPEPTSVFVSGNDAGAKATVTAMLQELGHTDVIDLGDITTARGTEWLMPFWLRLMQALGTPAFNYRIVRA
ncbi:MAG TPA: NAD(P)-binding domain-containing protein [Nocardioides sp.]|nr:NAD(P)-binding domain-containing protein [Nocardioides sp.]